MKSIFKFIIPGLILACLILTVLYTRIHTKVLRPDADPNTAATTKKLKRAIVILLCLTAVSVILAVIFRSAGASQDFETGDSLNSYAFEHYEAADFETAGDGVLYDSDGVTVSVEGFYTDETNGAPRLKIGYLIENRSGMDVCVSFERIGINGTVLMSGGDMSGWYEDGTSVVRYSSVYNTDETVIRELVYGNFKVYDDGDYLAQDRRFVTLTTTAAPHPAPELPAGMELFDDRHIRIVRTGNAENGFVLWILNDTPYDYRISSSDLRINGADVRSYGLSDQCLPKGYMIGASGFHSDEDAYLTMSGSDRMEISLSFRCARAPFANFETDYLILQGGDPQ